MRSGIVADDSKARYLSVRSTFRPLGRFLSMYILRAGFLDGWRGFVLAVLYANYVFLRMAKAWEARHGHPDKDSSSP